MLRIFLHCLFHLHNYACWISGDNLVCIHFCSTCHSDLDAQFTAAMEELDEQKDQKEEKTT
jgi:hypothetical protein